LHNRANQQTTKADKDTISLVEVIKINLNSLFPPKKVLNSLFHSKKYLTLFNYQKYLTAGVI